MLPLPDLTSFIHYLTKDAGTWLAALLPISGLLLGVSIVFIIAKAIINTIEDKLDWNEEKEDLLESKIAFQEILGAKSGAEAFEAFRLRANLTREEQKFLEPRDMMSGQTLRGLYGPTKYASGGLGLYPHYSSGQRLDPADFKKISIRDKLRNWAEQRTASDGSIPV